MQRVSLDKAYDMHLAMVNDKDKTIDMIPTELEELDNQFFEILDESISHLTDKTIDMEM